MISLLKRISKPIYNEPVSAVCVAVGLMISMLMISLSISFITEIQSIQRDKLNNAPPNAFMFSINIDGSKEKGLSVNQIANIFKETSESTGAFINNMLVNVDKAGIDAYYAVSSEWFQKDDSWHYPLSEGRYYTVSEIEEGKRVVLIGKKLMQYTELKSDKRFINISGESYEVLGVIGEKDKETAWDNRISIPITALPKVTQNQIENSSVSMIVYDANNKTKEMINIVGEEAKKIRSTAAISTISQLQVENVLKNAIQVNDPLLYIGALVHIVAIITSINIISFWIDKRRFEIGLRKALGHKNIQVITRIFSEILFIVTISYIGSLMVQSIMRFFMDTVLGYTSKLYISNLLVGILVILITTSVVSIVPIMKSLRVEPIESMKL